MARVTSKSRTATIPLSALLATEDDKAPRDILADLAGVEGGVVRVERVPPTDAKDQRLEFVGQWPAQQFTSIDDLLMLLRDSYGGGNFRVRGRQGGGKVHGAPQDYLVAKLPAASPAAAVTAAAGAPAPGPQPQKPDPIDTAVKIAGVISPVLLALIARPEPKAPTGLTIADAIMLSDRMSGGKQKTTLEMVQEFQALKDAMRDEDDKPAPTGATVMDLVNTAIRELSPLVKGALGMPGAPAPAAAQPAQPAPQVEALPDQRFFPAAPA